MRELSFLKYHGAGNDFLIFDAIAATAPATLEQLITLAPELCARHTGIGADGVLVVDRLDGRWRMRVINSDGSLAQMCGNGARCVARHLFEVHRETGSQLELMTGRGILTIHIHEEANRFVAATVDMGAPIFDAVRIPVRTPLNANPLELPLPIESSHESMPTVPSGSFAAVSMGNPHAIFQVDGIDSIDIRRIGPLLERATVFPEKANIHFVNIISQVEARIVTWERGAGATLACGTGACATLVALHRRGLLDRTAHIHVPGGTLKIDWREGDDHVLMTGPAEFVGRVEVDAGEQAGGNGQ